MTKVIGFKPSRTERLFIEKRAVELHKTDSGFLHWLVSERLAFELDPLGYISQINTDLAEKLKATQDALAKAREETDYKIALEREKQKTEAFKLKRDIEAAKDRAARNQPKVDYGKSDGGGYSEIGDGFYG